MIKLSVLHLEDNKDDERFFQPFFRDVMATVAELEYESLQTPEAAREALEKNPGAYHILLADLLFPDANDPKGKHTYQAGIAIREAAKHDRVVIIGLTRGRGDYATIDDWFEKDGGHKLIDKYAVKRFNKTPEQVFSELEPILRRKGYLSSGWPELDQKSKPDIRVDALVETVGADTLRYLLSEASPQRARYVPQYVAPGWSGAVVLGLHGYALDADEPDVGILMKCGTNRAKLEREVAHCPDPNEVDGEIYVPCRGPLGTAEWSAIVARFMNEALTLQEWLEQKGTTPDQVRTALSGMFAVLAKRYASTTKKAKHAQSGLHLLLPSLAGKARIGIAIQTLVPLVARAGHGSAVNADDLAKFVALGDVGSRSLASIESTAYTCTCHGDLHSRNVLVDIVSKRFLLIDPARRGDMHWASDVAQLCVDLWISSWDGHQEAHFWDRLSEWRQQMSNWLSGKKVEVDSKVRPNAGAWAASCWLVSPANLKKILGQPYAQCSWEFTAALAIQFLEASSWPETPAPKRCLALIGASDVLKVLATQLPKP